MNKFFEQTKKAASKARQASISNLNAASNVLSQASGTSIKLTTAKTDETLKQILEEEPILFSGSAWKRRGGLGKLASFSSAWETRHLQLRGNVLLYFDSDPTKALSSSNDPQELLRGYIDLNEEHASIHASYGHSGAPSPFCLTIKVAIGLAPPETKWKLSFDQHQTQMEWLAAISDVIIQCSVDTYNRALLEATNPNNPNKDISAGLLRRPRTVYEPGAKDGHHHSNHQASGITPPPRGRASASSPQISPTSTKAIKLVNIPLYDTPHQLWMMDHYEIERKTTQSKERLAKTKASVDTALQVMERLLSEERNQRSLANRKKEALEKQLEHAREMQEETSQNLAKVQAEKTDLEAELAIRISTHNLGDSSEAISAMEVSTPILEEKEKLKQQIQELMEKIELQDSLLEKARLDKQIALDEMKLEMKTKLAIADSEQKDALSKQKSETHEIHRKEVERLREELGGQVEDLKHKLDAARLEYQDSLQALAADFGQKLTIAERKYNQTRQNDADQKAGETSSGVAPDDKEVFTLNTSSFDEFEDCLES